MAEPIPPGVEGDPGRALWERLRARDPVAPSDLAATYVNPLTSWLVHCNPRVDPELCATAADEALVALIKQPDTYNPARQTLEVYLRVSASGDLKNLLRAEQRHRARRADLTAVELSPVVGKSLQDQREDPALVAEEDEMAAESRATADAIIAQVRRELSAEDAAALDLMLAEERRTGMYVHRMGLGGLPPSEQEREVKRAKDRVKKRILRARSAHE